MCMCANGGCWRFRAYRLILFFSPRISWGLYVFMYIVQWYLWGSGRLPPTSNHFIHSQSALHTQMFTATRLEKTCMSAYWRDANDIPHTSTYHFQENINFAEPFSLIRSCNMMQIYLQQWFSVRTHVCIVYVFARFQRSSTSKRKYNLRCSMSIDIAMKWKQPHTYLHNVYKFFSYF